MKRMNFKLLIWLLVTPAVLAVGIHFLHAYQIDRNAESLKMQAVEATNAGDAEDAIRQYSQYLKHRPDDAQAYSEFARLAADAAERPDATISKLRRAFVVMEEATRQHGDLVDLRIRMIDYCMKLGRIPDAMDHIDRLRADGHGEGPEMDVKYAKCLLGTGREEKAVKLLSRVIGYDPAKQSFSSQAALGGKEIDAYVLLAEVYRKQLEDSKDAEVVIHQLVEANPDVAKAYAERGRFFQRQKKFELANADLTKALEMAPKDADIIVSAAELAGALDHLDRANEILTDGLARHPKDERMFRAMASLALQEEKPDKAMKYVEDGLKQSPSNQYLLLFRADLELQKGDIEGVRSTVKSMRESDFLPELIEYIECRILIVEGQWLKATNQLEKLRPSMARFPDLTMQIDMLLGRCYRSLGQPDRAIDAYRRALDGDPSSIPAQLGYADALRQIGKNELANQVLKNLRKPESPESEESTSLNPVVNQNILQTSITEELQKPEDKRDWRQVDTIMAEVLKSDRLTEAQKAVLEAEIMLIKKDLKQARRLLSAAVRKHPKELAVWLGLINLVSQDENSKPTPEEVLDRAEKELGPVYQLKRARLAIAVRKQGEEAKQAIKKFESDLGGLSEDERIAFSAELGHAYYRLRDYEDARRCWLEFSKHRKDDAKIQLTLFELAREFDAEADMDATLEEIRKAQGAGSSLLKFCEAQKIVWQVKQKKSEPSALLDARRLLDEARQSRPDWHEIARLSGEINELEGKADLAIDDFKSALKLGPANPNVARRLVTLLYLRGRITEVDEAMSSIPHITDADPMRKIQIEKDIREGKLDEALVDAKKVVEAEPESVTNRLWYGQLLSRAGIGEEAAQAFREAVAKDPKLVQGWLMLVAHLAGTKQLVDAQAVIREAKSNLAEDAQNAFLAQAYEMVGDLQPAEENYQGLLAKKPKDLGMMRNVASFYLRTKQPDKGRKLLDNMLAHPDASNPKATDADKQHITWARRSVSQLVASRGDYRSLKEAITILDANKVNGKMAPEDMVLAAGILARSPVHSSRTQAIKWLEQVQEIRALSPDEQFVMAQLYEQTGDWPNARDLLLNLVTKIEGNLGLAGTFAQLLAKHDDLTEAERWIEKVETAQPDSPMAVQLRARLLAKQGKADQAGEMLVKLLDQAPNEEARLRMIDGVVAMLEEFEQFAAAEQVLRNAVQSFPRAKITLASFLGRQGDLNEAFALFEESRKSFPLPVVIQAASDTLRRRSAEAGKQHFAAVHEWLKAVIADDPKSLRAQLQLADLKEIQGRADEAISAYRQLLSDKNIDPKQRAIIDNNLAFVLVMNGGAADVEEALRLIDEAINELGPTSDLLDTRAMCLLAQGNTKKAIDDLRAAVIDAPSALKYIHLATAEAKSGNKAAAAKSLAKAQELKFDVTSLSAKERENFQKLSQQLKDD